MTIRVGGFAASLHNTRSLQRPQTVGMGCRQRGCSRSILVGRPQYREQPRQLGQVVTRVQLVQGLRQCEPCLHPGHRPLQFRCDLAHTRVRHHTKCLLDREMARQGNRQVVARGRELGHHAISADLELVSQLEVRYDEPQPGEQEPEHWCRVQHVNCHGERQHQAERKSRQCFVPCMDAHASTRPYQA